MAAQQMTDAGRRKPGTSSPLALLCATLLLACSLTRTADALPSEPATNSPTTVAWAKAWFPPTHQCPQLFPGTAVTSIAAQAYDSSGNLITLGFIDSPIETGVPIAGDSDAVIRKQDVDGNVLWTRYLATARFEYFVGLTVDAAGNAYVLGATRGSLPNKDPISPPSQGTLDVFVVKYSPLGDYLDAIVLGTTGQDTPLGICSSPTQSAIFVAYAPDNNVRIQRIATSPSLSATAPGTWTTNGQTPGAFYYELSTANQLNLRIQGSPGRHLACTPTTVVFAARATLTSFGPLTDSSNDFDIFVASLSASTGTPLWIRRAGATLSDEQYGAIAADTVGNVFVTGATAGSLNGQPVPAGVDAFLVKMDTQGNTLWTRVFGGVQDQYGFSVACDAEGGVVVIGGTEYKTFDGEPNDTDPSGSFNAIFLSRFDTFGDRLWSRFFTSNKALTEPYPNGFVFASDVAIDPQNPRRIAASFFSKRAFLTAVPPTLGGNTHCMYFGVVFRLTENTATCTDSEIDALLDEIDDLLQGAV